MTLVSRVFWFAACATLCACGPSSSGQPLPMPTADMEEVEQGVALYKAQGCTNCHGEDGLEDPLGVPSGNLGTSTLKEDGVFTVLRDGRNNMPAYGNISETERWALVAHVLGLRGEM